MPSQNDPRPTERSPYGTIAVMAFRGPDGRMWAAAATMTELRCGSDRHTFTGQEEGWALTDLKVVTDAHMAVDVATGK